MNIFIVGYFGFSNVGDDRILSKTIAFIRSRYPHVNLCVLCSSDYVRPSCNPPFCSSQTLAEVTYCSRNNVFCLIKTMIQMDQLVFGGGGIFQDKTSFWSLLYYGLLVFFAKMLRKKVVCLSQGFGPIDRSISKRLMAYLLPKIDGLSFRDAQSLEHASTFVDSRVSDKWVLSADMVYYNAIVASQYSVEKPPLVGLSLRPFYHSVQCRDAVTHFLSQVAHDFIFLDCHAHIDSDFLNREYPSVRSKLVGQLNFISLFSHQQLVTLLDDYRIFVLIGMRYHSCVWASLRGIPFLALAYDPKVSYLAKRLGQPCVDMSNGSVTQACLTDAYQDLLNRYDMYQSRLIEQTHVLIQDSHKNSALL